MYIYSTMLYYSMTTTQTRMGDGLTVSKVEEVMISLYKKSRGTSKAIIKMQLKQRGIILEAEN